MPEKGRQLDLTSAAGPQIAGQAENKNRFLGIHFTCCDVYSRVYPNCENTAYVGHCPRCAKPIRLQIGSGGTDSRFFTAQ